MYLDIPSYIHDTKWPVTFGGILVSEDGKAISNIDDFQKFQLFWMLCIYESNHKNQHLIQSQ